jgi:hypothetical protein
VEYTREWQHGGRGNELDFDAADASGADISVLAQDGYKRELGDAVGSIERRMHHLRRCTVLFRP